jgi:16S rRNA (adenine1518-N6/adenine1519-N6)-dimethyltransferase
MSHRPRKRFGQHFLRDQAVIQAIVHAIHPQAIDHMVEIGPGLGAITRPLLQTLHELTAIEIDTDLHELLTTLAEYKDKLNVIHADALTVDFSALGNMIRVVGNLPYNISTPLIMHLLDHKNHIDDMHFMLQKEVVERMAASPNCKAYGRLSIMVQYHCQTEYLFDVSADAFYPPPKVESAVIRLTPYRVSPYPNVCFPTFQKVVNTAFGMRRKTLANNLKPLLSTEALEALSIDPKKRPEQISINEYVQIAQFVSDSCKIHE